jgi:16S rRNA (cytosine967-C5)-methyltransferase
MTQPAPARRAAYAALRAVTANRADLPDALARARERLRDPRDHALAADIATGTLRWMGAIDAVIEAFGGRPVSRFDPEVLDILRLSIYQLEHHDRVPARAVVDDAVELARDARKTSAAGLVNAVLRRVGRERDRLPRPGRPGAGDVGGALDYLSVTLSHPRWLAARWLTRVGFDHAEAWARFNNAPAPLTLRANRSVITRDGLADRLAARGVTTEPTAFAPDGLIVVGGRPFGTPEDKAGAFVVQDEASQLVAAVANAAAGDRVLDACAAPGGKTVALAARRVATDSSSRAMSDPGALTFWCRRSRGAVRIRSASCGWTPPLSPSSPCSISCSSTRLARVLARFAGTRRSDGGESRRTCPCSRPGNVRCWNERRVP